MQGIGELLAALEELYLSLQGEFMDCCSGLKTNRGQFRLDEGYRKVSLIRKYIESGCKEGKTVVLYTAISVSQSHLYSCWYGMWSCVVSTGGDSSNFPQCWTSQNGMPIPSIWRDTVEKLLLQLGCKKLFVKEQRADSCQCHLSCSQLVTVLKRRDGTANGALRERVLRLYKDVFLLSECTSVG